MPKKPGPGRVPQHECRWFPISQDEAGEDQVWACGTLFRCIKTATRKKRVPPEPIMQEPTGGLWDAIIRH